MHDVWKNLVWQQFGGSIDMLENAIRACPEKLWSDRSRNPEFWYTAFHALFWLDLYLSPSEHGFAPPAPFGLEELDPAGVLPDRVYSKDELLSYLEHGRQKCRRTIAALTEESAHQAYRDFGQSDFSFAQLLLYNMRHVQHHAAQLNLLLRQHTDSAPTWVRRTKLPLKE